jgi:uncharacterized protein YndB with AHSA1/START domain
MSQSVRKRVEQNSNSYETVEVTRAVHAPLTDVWEALTLPGIVEKWFGRLTSPLVAGQPTTLEFGDGDFFEIQVTRLYPPTSLDYSWRFLGIGPRDNISWSIAPKGSGCLVTVRDTEAWRTQEDAALLRKGWLDFTNRLEKFLRKCKSTRYPWRHEFDGSIELAGGVGIVWRYLFERNGPAKWLPLGESGLQPGAEFTIDDGLEPSKFKITRVELNPPTGLQFDITTDEWLYPTQGKFNLSPRNISSLLSVSHNGWEAISLDKDYQREQRKRFCAFWIKTLRGAQSNFGL